MKCTECKGEGYHPMQFRAKTNDYLMNIEKYCRTCNGSGEVEEKRKCRWCGKLGAKKMYVHEKCWNGVLDGEGLC